MFILKWIKAKKNGIPLYIKDKWYNYRAMMTESEAKTTMQNIPILKALERI